MSLVIMFYFTSYTFNMFRTLIHPSSGACNFSIVSPHWCSRLQLATPIPPPTQPHRNSNTHRNKSTRPTWWYNRKVAGFWWWMYLCPKHVEHRRSEIKHNNKWHQVGLLFFNYTMMHSPIYIHKMECMYLSNTTLFDGRDMYRIYHIKNNYMFRHLTLAIFRLRNEKT